jgi:hypothetical protein
MADACEKFTDSDVDTLNMRICVAQESGATVQLTPRDCQLLRASLLCFMFRYDIVDEVGSRN